MVLTYMYICISNIKHNYAYHYAKNLALQLKDKKMKIIIENEKVKKAPFLKLDFAKTHL